MQQYKHSVDDVPELPGKCVAIEAGLRRGGGVGGVGGDDYEVEEEDGGDDDVEKHKHKHKHE